jgi:hypothetical protein
MSAVTSPDGTVIDYDRYGDGSAARSSLNGANAATNGHHHRQAPGSGERTCKKWTFAPSMVVVNCGKLFSSAWQARQS